MLVDENRPLRSLRGFERRGGRLFQSGIRLFDQMDAGRTLSDWTMHHCVLFDLLNIVHVQSRIEVSNYEHSECGVLAGELDKPKQSIPVVRQNPCHGLAVSFSRFWIRRVTSSTAAGSVVAASTQGAEEEKQHVPKCDANNLPDRRGGGEHLDFPDGE